MKTPEGRIKFAVRKYLKSIGAYRFSPVQMGIGSSTLDDLCCFSGRFLAIEYKAPGNAPTSRQLLTIKQIRDAKGIAIWGDSVENIIEQINMAFGLP